MTDKRQRHFKLGTTSFIFPDHILANVEKLGMYFDEIELLIFESRPDDVLPTKEDIRKLKVLSRELNVGYNIHLPYDVNMAGRSKSERQAAVDTHLKVMALFDPLEPSTYTLHLHLPLDAKKHITGDFQIIEPIIDPIINWQDRLHSSLCAFIPCIPAPEIISVETLDYPFFLVEDLVSEWKLSVCLDVGHQIKYGFDLTKTFRHHGQKASIIHLHGVDVLSEKRKDHVSLDRLPKNSWHKIKAILNGFHGIVSLEVFHLETLNQSLKFLSEKYDAIPSSIPGDP